MGALESSVYRPQCGYYADIVEEACALMESLLINQPFVDGNKRTAFAVFDVFLRINGKHFKMDSARLYTLIMHWIGLPPSMRLKNMMQDVRLFVLE
jgi:death-on-curing protein